MGGARNKPCCLGTRGLHFWPFPLGLARHVFAVKAWGWFWKRCAGRSAVPVGSARVLVPQRVAGGSNSCCGATGCSSHIIPARVWLESALRWGNPGCLGCGGPSLLQELLLAHPALGSKGFCCQKFHV